LNIIFRRISWLGCGNCS